MRRMACAMAIALALAPAALVGCSNQAADTSSTETTTTETSSSEATGAETEGTAEDWQNPVMNFIGVYAKDRCAITVEAKGAEGAKFSVVWGSSAYETREWEMEGTFDEETLSVSYTGARCIDRTYEDEDTSTETVVYEDGVGTFTFGDDGTLTWADETDHAADGMTFTWAK